MQNLFQLLKSTMLQINKKPQHFLYPTKGMYEAWESVAASIRDLGGEIYTGIPARLEGGVNRIEAVHVKDLRIEPSQVVWTGPITQACSQLGLPKPELKYLGLLLFNVMVKEDAPRDYQWCYYGAQNLVFNRISTPRFLSPDTCPPGTTGYCCEVTCMVGDERWKNGEMLTDWIIDDLMRVGMLKKRSNVINIGIERLPNSYPIYKLDYPQHLEAARQALSAYENLRLAGRTGLFWYNNMDHSMENAMQLTKRLLREAGNPNIDQAKLVAGL